MWCRHHYLVIILTWPHLKWLLSTFITIAIHVTKHILFHKNISLSRPHLNLKASQSNHSCWVSPPNPTNRSKRRSSKLPCTLLALDHFSYKRSPVRKGRGRLWAHLVIVFPIDRAAQILFRFLHSLPI